MKPTVKISVKNAETIKKLATLAKPAEKGTAFKVGIIDDPEVATYAAYNEFGWVQRVTPKQSVYLSGRLNYSVKKNGFANAPIKPGMTLSSPPRPFLRGTADAKKEEWRDLIAQGIKTIGVQQLPKIIELVARQAQVDVQETIKNNGTDKRKFPDRSPVQDETRRSFFPARYCNPSGTKSNDRRKKFGRGFPRRHGFFFWPETPSRAARSR